MAEVEVEEDLVMLISKKCNKTQFKSVDEYVNFVLRELLREEEPKGERDLNEEFPPKDHLKDLGYL